MKTKLIKIGNSKVIIIPLRLIKLVHLEEDIELIAENGRIIIQNLHRPRANWDKAFADMANHDDDNLLNLIFPSSIWD